jgi:xanthine dehydrogenase accessory factor
MTELAEPLCVRRSVAFAEAVFDGHAIVEGVAAWRAEVGDIATWQFQNAIPVVLDESGKLIAALQPDVVIDARILKRRADNDINHARIVGVLGPGSRAGVDCHFVVETRRGHNLGRVIYEGEAEPDTGEPAAVLGCTYERTVYTEQPGVFEAAVRIGQLVKAGTVVGTLDGRPIHSRIAGTVRGVLRSGVTLRSRTKVADVDPRNCPQYCFTISDRSNAIAGGVLEGVFALRDNLIHV